MGTRQGTCSFASAIWLSSPAWATPYDHLYGTVPQLFCSRPPPHSPPVRGTNVAGGPVYPFSPVWASQGEGRPKPDVAQTLPSKAKQHASSSPSPGSTHGLRA
jgi:hypothetical protein